MSRTTWRTLLAAAMEDDAGPVEAYAPDEAAFDIEFNDDFGRVAGPPVLAWTPTRVYFPVAYDCSEWIGSAPRNPVADGQEHEGGL